MLFLRSNLKNRKARKTITERKSLNIKTFFSTAFVIVLAVFIACGSNAGGPLLIADVTWEDYYDGEDEVIIYREFVNNVHDNYILVDFFEIEEDTVTDISPSADISELSDIAWHTEVVSGHTEEYTIVLKMESYRKTAGILYTDKKMTIGYDKECWRVIE